MTPRQILHEALNRGGEIAPHLRAFTQSLQHAIVPV